MKKNLRNILVLSLGLITTIASAQWSANSTTWVDNADDNRSAITRSTVSMDLSGVHVSSDYTWYSGDADFYPSQGEAAVYEAYVSTDVMGYGTLTLGRQDLSFGSGALISSNNWGNTRHTTDGANFAASFGGFDINAGTYEMGMGGLNTNTTYLNASGSFSGISVNALMIDNDGVKATGYDLGYSMMDGDLNLNYSMNDNNGAELTIMGISYQVFDNMSINASMREYGGDGHFGAVYEDDGTGVYVMTANNAPQSAWVDGLNAGVLPHFMNGTETLSYGMTYALGDLGLSYTMHTISAGGEDVEFNDMSITYNLNDNASLGYRTYEVNGEDLNVITIGIGL
jgi:hypothetical protein